MTPLERAARALYRSSPHDFDPNQMGEDATWPDLVVQACAVLQAIREPSDAQREPFTEKLHWDDLDQDDVWQTMIDAALEQG